MSRQQRRVIHKLTGEELADKEKIATAKGVQGTLNIVYEVMNKDFGFGNVRLNKLEAGIFKKLGVDV